MIEIYVTSYNGRSPPLELKAVFGPTGGTLGRGSENRLVLPDPARHVSRLQAQIRFDAGGFRIANVSAGNPLFLNDRELPSGDEQPLVPGDELRVGLYVLGVRESAPPEPPVVAADDALRLQETIRPAPIGSGSLPLGLRTPGDVAPDPFADLLGTNVEAAPSAAGRSGASDPFADLMKSATPPPEAPAAVPIATPTATPAIVPAARIIPEDFDPFILPGTAQRAAANPSVGSAPPTRTGGRIDAPAEDFAAPEVPALRPAAEHAAAAVPAPQPVVHLPDQPIPPGPTPAPPAATAAPTHFAAAEPEAGTHVDHDALLAAFLKGAHVSGTSLPTRLTPQLMESLGTLVYHATAGAMELVAARQITKREMRSDVTMIVPKGNNPLKFLPTPEAAIIQMLGPNLPGFISTARAMEEVFEDLRAHEVGVIAGMRAAMTEALRQFDPVRLEEAVPKPAFPLSLFPARREAALWQAFAAKYREVWQHTQDDTQTQFGDAFISAYEEQVGRDRAKRGRQ
jgi:type VI secretion system FHA domain protein